MKIRILVGLCITAAVMLVAVLGSGAPARVHVAEAVALLIGFTIPACFVGNPGDVVRRWKVVLPAVLLGALAWDVAASVTISKVDAFSLPAVYAVVPVTMVVLLAAHGLTVDVATRRRGSRGAVKPAVTADSARWG